MDQQQKEHYVQAVRWWADGEELQLVDTHGAWKNRRFPFREPSFGTTYRIKPKPRWVPWTVDTFPTDRPVWVRGDYGWRSIGIVQIVECSQGGVTFGGGNMEGWGCLLAHWAQSDGSPCGTEEK